MMPYWGTPGFYHSDPRLKFLQYMSWSEFASPHWLEGLQPGTVLGQVKYMGISEIAIAHHWFTNVVCNVYSVAAHNIVQANNLTESRSMQIV